MIRFRLDPHSIKEKQKNLFLQPWTTEGSKQASGVFRVIHCYAAPAIKLIENRESLLAELRRTACGRNLHVSTRLVCTRSLPAMCPRVKYCWNCVGGSILSLAFIARLEPNVKIYSRCVWSTYSSFTADDMCEGCIYHHQISGKNLSLRADRGVPDFFMIDDHEQFNLMVVKYSRPTHRTGEYHVELKYGNS